MRFTIVALGAYSTKAMEGSFVSSPSRNCMRNADFDHLLVKRIEKNIHISQKITATMEINKSLGQSLC